MRHTLLTASLALALGLCARPSHAALPPGISGSWYNPPQSGHGLSIGMLDGDSALAYWFVFDPAGNPMHLYIEGAVQDHTIMGTAYLGRGMRFGEFDPADHTLTEWGEVEIAFNDCDNATLAWNADGPAGAGYPAGSMPLKRLTRIAGTSCDFGARVAAGVYSGTLSNRQYRQTEKLHALVGADGGFWAASEVLSYPPGRPFGFAGAVLTGATDSTVPITIGAELRTNEWLRHLAPPPWNRPPFRPPLPIELSVVSSGPDGVSIGGSTRHEQDFDVALASGQGGPELDAVASVAELAGTYGFTPVSMYAPSVELLITIQATGELCIQDVASVCAFVGTIAIRDEGAPLEFSVRHHERTHVVFEGVGWREHGGDAPPTLVLVATDDEHGFGIVAEMHPVSATP